MSEQRYYGEKEEKEHEKEEKEYEKQGGAAGEKDWEEKWRSDPVRAAGWAAILIWAGVAMLLENIGVWRQLGLPSDSAWPMILLGAGLIVLTQVAVRLTVAEYRRPITGSLVIGLLLVAAGLGELVQVDITGPLVLIAIGLILLFSGIFRRR